MAFTQSRFDTQLLDDLPPEILANIWEQCFADTRVSHISRDRGTTAGPRHDILANVFLINKKQSSIAKQAMLKHSTVMIRHGRDAADLLRNGPALSSIRSVHISLLPTSRYPFALMDDLFRAMSRLENLVMVSTSCVPVSPSQLEAAGGAKAYFQQSAKAKAPWMRKLMQSSLTPKPGFFSDFSWVVDILNGSAFDHVKKPNIFLGFRCGIHKADMIGYPVGPHHAMPLLVYHPQTRSLLTPVSGKVIKIRQKGITDHMFHGGRGCRGPLCNQNPINDTVRDTIEGILGRSLTIEEAQNYASHEDMINPSVAPMRVEIEVALAVRSLYGFEIWEPNCKKVVDWLESRLTPVLQLRSIEDAQDMIARVEPYFENGDAEISVLKYVWRPSWSTRSFINMMNFYCFLAPILAANHSFEDGVYWRMFKELYLPNFTDNYQIFDNQDAGEDDQEDDGHDGDSDEEYNEDEEGADAGDANNDYAAGALLDATFEQNGRVKKLLDLYLLITPALTSPKHGIARCHDGYGADHGSEAPIWWEYFQLLYLTGPDGRWEVEHDAADDDDGSGGSEDDVTEAEAEEQDDYSDDLEEAPDSDEHCNENDGGAEI